MIAFDMSNSAIPDAHRKGVFVEPVKAHPEWHEKVERLAKPLAEAWAGCQLYVHETGYSKPTMGLRYYLGGVGPKTQWQYMGDIDPNMPDEQVIKAAEVLGVAYAIGFKRGQADKLKKIKEALEIYECHHGQRFA